MNPIHPPRLKPTKFQLHHHNMIPIIGAQFCKEYEYSIFLNIYHNPVQQEKL